MNTEKKLFDNVNQFDETALYRFLAMINNFIQTDDTIYKNSKGEKFILTKYGFKPTIQHNLEWKIEELEKKLKDLEIKNENITKKHQNLVTQYELVTNKNKKLKKTNIKLASQNKTYCHCGNKLTYKNAVDHILIYCEVCEA